MVYMMDSHTEIRSSKSRNTLFLVLGFAFVGIGAIGVFMPLIPTTPFLLVAAACFAKSSDRWHQWLMSSRVFGPTIRNWQDKRCISRRTKTIAIATILAFGGSSIFFLINDMYMRVAGGLLLSVGLVVVGRMNVCENEPSRTASSGTPPGS